MIGGIHTCKTIEEMVQNLRNGTHLGRSPAHGLTILFRDTAMMSMRRAIDGLSPEEIRNLPKDKLNLPVSFEDFLAAIKKINRSVSDDDLEKHKKWSDEFGST